MLIRKATSNDLNAIIDCWKEMMDFHVEKDFTFKIKENAELIYKNYLESCIGQKDKLILVAGHENENIEGYIFAEITERPPVYTETNIGSINEIAVYQNCRRNDTGGLLLNEAYNWFIQNDISRIECAVAVTNEIANRFWKKQGFKENVCIHIKYI